MNEQRTSTGHPSNSPTLEDTPALFAFHTATEEQRGAMENVREDAKSLVNTMLRQCPPCADRSAAIRAVREAVWAANAAIMLEGK